MKNKYKVVCFTMGNKKFYQARVKLGDAWWYSCNFYDNTLAAGDEARKLIYEKSNNQIIILQEKKILQK
jgi:hypothetical protein